MVCIYVHAYIGVYICAVCYMRLSAYVPVYLNVFCSARHLYVFVCVSVSACICSNVTLYPMFVCVCVSVSVFVRVSQGAVQLQQSSRAEQIPGCVRCFQTPRLQNSVVWSVQKGCTPVFSRKRISLRTCLSKKKFFWANEGNYISQRLGCTSLTIKTQTHIKMMNQRT